MHALEQLSRRLRSMQPRTHLAVDTLASTCQALLSAEEMLGLPEVAPLAPTALGEVPAGAALRAPLRGLRGWEDVDSMYLEPEFRLGSLAYTMLYKSKHESRREKKNKKRAMQEKERTRRIQLSEDVQTIEAWLKKRSMRGARRCNPRGKGGGERRAGQLGDLEWTSHLVPQSSPRSSVSVRPNARDSACVCVRGA